MNGPKSLREHRATALRLAAAQWPLALPEPVIEQLLAYLDLLERWNRVYNLSAVRDPEQMLVQHVLDCLAVVPAIERRLAAAGPSGSPSSVTQQDSPSAAGLKLLDVGSGGGLPGVVLAMVRPLWTVDCVDTVGKKASFIGQVAAELRLPGLRGLHSRVEQLASPSPNQAGDEPGYQIVTSRAFASLRDFTHLTRQLLAPSGVWMAMKGRLPYDELADLPSSIAVFHVEQLTVPGLNAERCLVWMRPANTTAQAPNNP